MTLTCYRVYFHDGAAILVNAVSYDHAQRKALAAHSDSTVERIETLNDPA